MAITRLGGANAITGTIPTSVAPGQGKILQVSDMVSINTEQTLATETYTDLTSASINITPSSTSSKIFMHTNVNAKYHVGGSGYGLKFFRDSTAVFESHNTIASYMIDQTERDIASFSYIDSPSTTSQITYKIKVGTYLGREVRFQNSCPTTFYLMEIQG